MYATHKGPEGQELTPTIVLLRGGKDVRRHRSAPGLNGHFDGRRLGLRRCASHQALRTDGDD